MTKRQTKEIKKMLEDLLVNAENSANGFMAEQRAKGSSMGSFDKYPYKAGYLEAGVRGVIAELVKYTD